MKVLDALNQTEVWYSLGGPMPVAEMGACHAYNTLRLLDRQADRLHLAAVLEMGWMATGVNGEAAADALEMELMHFESHDPLEWVQGTPLYRAIEARATMPGGLVRARNQAWRLTHR